MSNTYEKLGQYNSGELPVAPTVLTITATTETTTSFTWQNNTVASDYGTAKNVMQKWNGTIWQTISSEMALNVTTFTATGLTGGMTYRYRIAVLNYSVLYPSNPLTHKTNLPPMPVTAHLVAWYGDLVNNGTSRLDLADGAALHQWDDQKNSYHLDAVSGTPVYDKTNDVLDFTSGALYNLTHNPVGSSYTKRCVIQVTYPETVTGTNDISCLGHENGNIGAMMNPRIYNTTQNRVFYGANEGKYSYFLSSFAINTWYVCSNYCSAFNGDSGRLRVNGVVYPKQGFPPANLMSTQNGVVGGGGYLTAADEITIRGGVRNAEILIYDDLLTTEEFEAIEGWLNLKYSIGF